MGFQLDIGDGAIALGERQVKNVQFRTEIPQDSNARATAHGADLKVWGKMLFDLEAAIEDPTLNMALWSQVASDEADCYRKVVATVVSAGQTVREFTLPNAFVVEYSETLDDETGVGEFYLHVKQKKDLTGDVAIESRF